MRKMMWNGLSMGRERPLYRRDQEESRETAFHGHSIRGDRMHYHFAKKKKKEIGPVNSRKCKYSGPKIDSQEIGHLSNANNHVFFSKHPG